MTQETTSRVAVVGSGSSLHLVNLGGSLLDYTNKKLPGPDHGLHDMLFTWKSCKIDLAPVGTYPLSTAPALNRKRRFSGLNYLTGANITLILAGPDGRFQLETYVHWLLGASGRHLGFHLPDPSSLIDLCNCSTCDTWFTWTCGVKKYMVVSSLIMDGLISPLPCTRDFTVL